MKKNKQNTYTCMLLATCFVASPFIFHKIWKTSSDSKNVSDVPSSSVSEVEPEVTGEPVIADFTFPEGAEETEVVTAAVPSEDNSSEAPAPTAAETIPPTEAPKPDIFVSGDISYFDDALFIGDSRTVGIKEYGTLTNADYFCSIGMMASKIDSENIDGVTFDRLIDTKQYGKIYLMLGINEVGNDFEFTLTQYRAVVERLKAHQQNALIVLQGNLHVARSAESNVINNERINYLNSLIEGLADNKKVFYIDINEVYDDQNGYLTESYTSDGIHPLAKYYKEWCEFLCSKEVPVNTQVVTADEVDAARIP